MVSIFLTSCVATGLAVLRHISDWLFADQLEAVSSVGSDP